MRAKRDRPMSNNQSDLVKEKKFRTDGYKSLHWSNGQKKKSKTHNGNDNKHTFFCQMNRKKYVHATRLEQQIAQCLIPCESHPFTDFCITSRQHCCIFYRANGRPFDCLDFFIALHPEHAGSRCPVRFSHC